MNETRRERIAGPEPINDLNLVGPRLEEFAILPGDGRPRVAPDQRVFTQSDRHDLQGEAFRRLPGHVLVVLALDAEDALRVLLGGDEDVAELHQVAHAPAGLFLAPELG